MGEGEIIPPGGGHLARIEPSLPVPSERPDISGASSDEQLISIWLSQSNLSAHTVRLYSRVAMKLLKWLPKGIKGATVLDISAFEISLRKLKMLSKHTEMSAVRSLFRFAERTNYIVKSPAHVHANRRPADRKRQRILSEDEVWALIDHAGSHRNAMMLAFLYGTGVRISEFRMLTWKDSALAVIGNKQLQVVTVIGKRGVLRDVPVPLWAEVDRPASADDDDAMFPAVEEGLHPWPAISESALRWIVREAARRAGINRAVSPHWFRHSVCTHLQDHGVPPKDVQVLLGHASLDTTTGYSHADLVRKGAPSDILKRRKPDDRS